jgi:hypothetical protein
MRLFGLVWEWYVIVWASLGFVWALEVTSIQWHKRKRSTTTCALPHEYFQPLVAIMFQLSTAAVFKAWCLAAVQCGTESDARKSVSQVRPVGWQLFRRPSSRSYAHISYRARLHHRRRVRAANVGARWGLHSFSGRDCHARLQKRLRPCLYGGFDAEAAAKDQQSHPSCSFQIPYLIRPQAMAPSCSPGNGCSLPGRPARARRRCRRVYQFSVSDGQHCLALAMAMS